MLSKIKLIANTTVQVKTFKEVNMTGKTKIEHKSVKKKEKKSVIYMELFLSLKTLPGKP